MAFVIGAPCIDVIDRSRMEEFPVDCIYQGDRMVYINPAECIDCGACEPACPTQAITPDRRLPQERTPFRDVAFELFADAEPGGQRSVSDPGLVSGRQSAN